MRIFIILVFMGLFSSLVYAEEVDWNRLVNAVIQVESGSNPNAYNSRSGAIGLMQITPIVLKEFNNSPYYIFQEDLIGEKVKSTDLYCAYINRRVGTWYLTIRIPELLKAYNIKDTIDNRLWAYNAGIGNVKKGIKHKETREYIKKVIKIYEKR